MRRIVVMPTHPDAFRLAIREDGRFGVVHQPFLRLDRAQAEAVVGTHTGILFDPGHGGQVRKTFDPAGSEGAPCKAPKLPLRIEKIRDRRPESRAWQVRIGDRLVTGDLDGVEVPRRIDDDHVRALADCAVVSFERGEPDWSLRDIEKLEERAAALRTEAEELDLRVAELRRARLEARREEDAAIDAWEV
jgi:hypothetical protein